MKKTTAPNSYLLKMRDIYPEYTAIDDETFALSFKDKHYTDIDDDTFLETVGLKTKAPISAKKNIQNNLQEESTEESKPLTYKEKFETGELNYKTTNPQKTAKEFFFGNDDEFVSKEWNIQEEVIDPFKKSAIELAQESRAADELLSLDNKTQYESKSAKKFNENKETINTLNIGYQVEKAIAEQTAPTTKPKHNVDTFIDAFKKEGVLSPTTWGEFAKAVPSIVSGSVPQMYKAITNLPDHIKYYSYHLAKESLEKDGVKTKPSLSNMGDALPMATLLASIDRIQVFKASEPLRKELAKNILLNSKEKITEVIKDTVKSVKEQVPMEIVQEDLETLYINDKDTTGEDILKSTIGAVMGASGTAVGITTPSSIYQQFRKPSNKEEYLEQELTNALENNTPNTSLITRENKDPDYAKYKLDENQIYTIFESVKFDKEDQLLTNQKDTIDYKKRLKRFDKIVQINPQLNQKELTNNEKVKVTMSFEEYFADEIEAEYLENQNKLTEINQKIDEMVVMDHEQIQTHPLFELVKQKGSTRYAKDIEKSRKLDSKGGFSKVYNPSGEDIQQNWKNSYRKNYEADFELTINDVKNIEKGNFTDDILNKVKHDIAQFEANEDYIKEKDEFLNFVDAISYDPLDQIDDGFKELEKELSSTDDTEILEPLGIKDEPISTDDIKKTISKGTEVINTQETITEDINDGVVESAEENAEEVTDDFEIPKGTSRTRFIEDKNKDTTDNYIYFEDEVMTDNGYMPTVNRRVATDVEMNQKKKNSLVDTKWQSYFDEATITDDGYLKTKSLPKNKFKDFNDYLKAKEIGKYINKKGFKIENQDVIDAWFDNHTDKQNTDTKNPLVPKAIADTIRQESGYTGEVIPYSHFSNMQVGVNKANYQSQLESMYKLQDDIEAGIMPKSKHTQKELDDKMTFIEEFEKKNNIIREKGVINGSKQEESKNLDNTRDESTKQKAGDKNNNQNSQRSDGDIQSSDIQQDTKTSSNSDNGEQGTKDDTKSIKSFGGLKVGESKKTNKGTKEFLGKNKSGEDVFKDNNGVRTHTDMNGQITISQAVGIAPDGIDFVQNIEGIYNKDGSDFLTVDEIELLKESKKNDIIKEEVKNNDTSTNDKTDTEQSSSNGSSGGELGDVQQGVIQGASSQSSTKSTSQVQSESSDKSNRDDGTDDKTGVSTPRSKRDSDEGTYTQDILEDDNYTIEDELGEGGAKTKFNNNIEAIKIVKQIQEKNYKPTSEDKKILSKYVGWGGLSNAFYKPDGTTSKQWKKEAKILKELLSDTQYNEARRSTQDAHYTSKEIVNAIWDGVQRLGFKGGNALEPSVGVGNFFGFMPTKFKTKTKLYGVELDGITSTIAQTLYPKANIQNKGFQDVVIENGSYSLVIGNPPFGSQSLFDKNKKHLKGMSIHNYFFSKSMDALEEGGILAMVVSNGLLDSGNTKAREYLGTQANLVGAMRLPNNAFSKNANTEVTTDIIFLQKRYKDQESNIDSWKDIGELNDTPLNNYFVNNQDNLLGKWGKYGTMYRGDSPALIVDETKPSMYNLMSSAITQLPKNIVTHEAVLKEDNTKAKFDGDISKVRMGAMFINTDGTIHKRTANGLGGVAFSKEVSTKLNSKDEVVEYTPKELAKIKAMIEVVSVADELRALQIDSKATQSQLDKSRKELNKTYDGFVKKFGYLNNATTKKLFEEDIRSPFLLALEKDYQKAISSAVAKKTGELPRKESASKSDIFYKRTQTPYVRPTKAANSQDALTISLSEYGNIDFDYMGELTGKSEEQLIKELDGFIYEDINDGWVTKEEFLSGDVKAKFKETDNPKYKEILKTVIPKDIDAVDISVTLGASWIPKEDMKDFVTHITGDNNPTVNYVPYSAKWGIDAAPTSANTSRWGTDRRSVNSILEATANLSTMEVKNNLGTSSSPQWVVDTDATTAVQEKQEQLKEEFKEWIWKDASRRGRLGKLYNEKFNNRALREFDGSHLNFVGKSDTINLRQHQKNGVWRVLQGGTVLFDHTVGTGKTFTAIASVMELRRTGKAKKPLIVVPNHLTSQWGKEWMEIYPSANILVPTEKDFSSKRRKLLMSRMATGDYDGIIIGHSQLTMIQNDLEFEKSFIADEINRIQDAIDMLKAEDGKSRSVKDAEKSKERLEEKLERLNDTARDDNLDFSQLGVDSIVVDEAHEFKNLTYTTGLQKVAGLGNPQGSKKAFDLFIKTQNLLEKTDGNNVIFLTGTPISNTIAEMFTIQRYLNYSKLKDDNLDIFDAWVKQNAEIISDWELTPSGKYKLNTRLRKFNNMPELITEYKQFSDVVTREDIPSLPIPNIKGGRPQNIVVDRSEAQANYIGIEDKNKRYPEHSLVYRSEHLPKGKPKKGDDNMLKIMGEARKVALDMRLINPNLKDNPDSKVNLTVKNVYDTYLKWNDKKGTQLIFCDLSTPKGSVAKEKAKISALIKKADDGDEKAINELEKMNPDDLDALNSEFSVYDDIKEKLILKGINENEIAFIHDANTKIQKQELFDKVKSGRVRVLLGSTSKMGAGMNVQDRLVALHHIDVPWRPSDLEQREGRIIRQGNLFYNENPNFEIEIYRYATKNTLDSMMWQTIEAKANFIEQLRAGNLLDREVEDVSGEAVSAGEMKALSSGNPLILEDMKLKKDIKKLNALKKNHDRNQFDIEEKVKKGELFLKDAPLAIEKLKKDIEKAKKLPKKFTINIEGKEYKKREEAGEDIINIIINTPKYTPKKIGTIGEFDIYIENNGKGILNDEAIASVELVGEGEYSFDIGLTNQSYQGLTTKIENTLKNNIAGELVGIESDVKDYKDDIPQLKEQLGEFKGATELEQLKARQKEVLAELRKKDDDKQDTDTDTDTDTDELNSKVPQEQIEKEENEILNSKGVDNVGDNYIKNIQTKGFPDRDKSGKIDIDGTIIDLPTVDAPQTVESVREFLKDIIGTRLYDGRVKGKTRLGFYNRVNTGMRVKSYHDIEVQAHEMAHYLDFFYNNPPKKAKTSFFKSFKDNNKEFLKSVSYTQQKSLAIPEGFAEFVRLYTTQYNNLVDIDGASEVIAQFEATLSKDKELQNKLHKYREEVHKYYYQGHDERMSASSDSSLNKDAQKIKNKKRRTIATTKQNLVDKNLAIKIAEEQIKGKEPKDAMDSPYKMFNLINGSDGTVDMTMEYGIPTIDKNGDIQLDESKKGLDAIFKPLFDGGHKKVRLWENYAKARRGAELKEQGRENRLDDQMIKSSLKLVETYPEFETMFDEYQEFNDAMLDFYVGMNLITDEQKESFQEFNKDYVPFHRVKESISQGRAMEDVGSARLGTRLTGGDGTINNILDNIYGSLEKNIKDAYIARAKTSLYTMLSKDGGEFAMKIGTDTKKVKADIRSQSSNVAGVLYSLGMGISKGGMIVKVGENQYEDVLVDIDDIASVLEANPELLEAWSIGHPPQSKDKMIDSAIIDGKRVYFEINDPMLIDTLTSQKGVTIDNKLMKFGVAYKNLSTFMITNNPLFYFTNAFRDTVSASAFSENGFVPFYHTAKGMWHFVAKDKMYKNFMTSGAGYSTRATALGSFDDINVNRNRVIRYFGAFEKLMNALSYGADMFEYGTRIGEFELSKKKGKSNLEGAYNAREISTDFSRTGSSENFRKFLGTVAFAKAGINSIDRFYRRLKDKKTKADKVRFYMMGSAIATFTIALASTNDDDERYKKLTKDQKSMYWWIYLDNFIDKDTLKDMGINPIWKLPKPYDVGIVFANVPEMMFEYISDRSTSDELQARFLFDFFRSGGVMDFPSVFKGALEIGFNKDWRGVPIETLGMQFQPKELRATSYTPEAYKELGNKHLSPVQMHHLSNSFLGLYGRMLDDLLEVTMWDETAKGERAFAKYNPLDYLSSRLQGKEVESRTKYDESFYKHYQNMVEVHGEINLYKKTKDKIKYKEFTQDKNKRILYGLKSYGDSVQNKLSSIRKNIQNIKDGKKSFKTAQAKEKEINRLLLYKQKMLEEAVRRIEDKIARGKNNGI